MFRIGPTGCLLLAIGESWRVGRKLSYVWGIGGFGVSLFHSVLSLSWTLIRGKAMVVLVCWQGFLVCPMLTSLSDCSLPWMLVWDGVLCPLTLQPPSRNIFTPFRHILKSSFTPKGPPARALSAIWLLTHTINSNGCIRCVMI